MGLIRQERPLQRLDFAQVAAGQDQAPLKAGSQHPKGGRFRLLSVAEDFTKRESLPGTALTTSGAMSRQSSQKVGSPVTTLPMRCLVADFHHPMAIDPDRIGPLDHGIGKGRRSRTAAIPPSTAIGMPLNLTIIWPGSITGPPP